MSLIEMKDPISFEAAREYIDQLDLGYIIDKMCSPHYPLPRWNLSDAKQCAQLYKNYLILIKKHFSQRLVPTREIDEFWHNHILYTENYVRDCEHIFGEYLHHHPASPIDDAEKLIKGFEKTKRLYLEEFKQPLSLIS